MQRVGILVVIAVAFVAAAVLGDWHESAYCEQSDAQLLWLRKTICASLTQSDTWWCGAYWSNTSAKEDWPTQAVYMQNLFDALANPSTCVNTSYAADTVNWLNTVMSDATILGTFQWTYAVFQPQYYDMPRKPGARIESPWTLGLKCWAMAFLQQYWNPEPLNQNLQSANLTLANFTGYYLAEMPKSITLCYEVKNNCFVNASYDPKRAGTCPLAVDEFKLGFDWQGIKEGINVKDIF